jgi:hypothetical protein
MEGLLRNAIGPHDLPGCGATLSTNALLSDSIAIWLDSGDYNGDATGGPRPSSSRPDDPRKKGSNLCHWEEEKKEALTQDDHGFENEKKNLDM